MLDGDASARHDGGGDLSHGLFHSPSHFVTAPSSEGAKGEINHNSTHTWYT